MSEKSSDLGLATNKQLDGDRPAKGLADDRLGYASFSRAMARAIHSMVPREGIVLSVNGAWGSGKTSAINMMVEALRELQANTAEDERTVVVYFNPWWFSAQEDLVRAFFNDIAASLEEEKLSEKIVGGLKAVGRRASKAKDIVLGVLDLVPGGAVVKGVTGAAIDAVGRASSVERSLAAERAELDEALRSQHQRILVVIDDVDRLPADEARQIFRMVKSVADLPNVIHLLVFDRAIARKALGAEINDDGPDWLDKIVQASFDLPPVRSADLQRLLLSELDALAKPRPFIDFVRWGNTLQSAIMPWLTYPRDVRRLVNALAVSWPAVSKEVDFADFVALETMRLFEPELHAMVKRNEAKLTGGEQFDKEAYQHFANDLLSAVKRSRNQVAQEALWRLFPRLEKVWRNHSYSNGSQTKWDSERRVCVTRHFHAYFGFDVGEDALRQSEIEDAIADLAEPVKFRSRVLNYASQPRASGGNKAAVLLDELRAHTQSIPGGALPCALRSIAISSDAFYEGDSGTGSFLSVPLMWQVWSSFAAVARRIPEDDRADMVREALDDPSSLNFLSFVVRKLSEDHGRRSKGTGDRERELLVNETVLDKLQAVLMAQLRVFAQSLELLDQRHLIHLLLHWHELDEDEARKWIASQIDSDKGAIAIGEASIVYTTVHTSGDHVAVHRPSVNREILAKIVDVDLLESRLAKIAASPNEKGKHVHDLFQAGLDTPGW